MSVTALVPAAGLGARLGLGIPKAFVVLGGQTLLERSVRMLASVVDTVIVIVPSELCDAAKALLPAETVVVEGGAERTDSVRLGLSAARCGAEDFVLVHDAARALTPSSVVERVVAALRGGASAVIPVLPVIDTIKTADGLAVTGTVDRTTLRSVQTPQGFRADVLRRAYASGGFGTDDSSLVERLGVGVTCVAGDPYALKITTQFDLRIAEALL